MERLLFDIALFVVLYPYSFPLLFIQQQQNVQQLVAQLGLKKWICIVLKFIFAY